MVKLLDKYDELAAIIDKLGGSWLHKEMLKLFLQCLDVAIKKTNDYASKDDPLENFRLSAQMELCSTPVSILIRSCDKFKRICNLIHKPNAVEDESILDSISDLIAYMAMLYVYLTTRQNMVETIKKQIGKLIDENGCNIDGFDVVYHIDKDVFEITILGDNIESEFYDKIKEFCKQIGAEEVYFSNSIDEGQ